MRKYLGEKESWLDKIRKRFGRKMNYPATAEDILVFKESYKKDQPIRHFLFETVPDTFETVWYRLLSPLDKLKYAVLYRTLCRFHVVNTRLKPGYCDKDEIMLHANFSLLVDFVEIEYALEPSKEDVKHDKSLRGVYWKSKLIPGYHHMFRSPEIGVRRLEECLRYGESELDAISGNGNTSPDYLERLKEDYDTLKTVLDLYRWWTVTRPQQRRDLENRETLRAFHEATNHAYSTSQLIGGNVGKEHQEAFRKFSDDNKKLYLLEELLDNEDQEMLLKLISIRRSLWT